MICVKQFKTLLFFFSSTATSSHPDVLAAIRFNIHIMMSWELCKIREGEAKKKKKVNVLAMKERSHNGAVLYVESGELLGTHGSQMQCVNILESLNTDRYCLIWVFFCGCSFWSGAALLSREGYFFLHRNHLIKRSGRSTCACLQTHGNE